MRICLDCCGDALVGAPAHAWNCSWNMELIRWWSQRSPMRFSCLKFVRVLTWRIRNWNKHRRCCLSWRSSFSQVPGIQQELQSCGEMPLNTCMRRMCNILIVEASSTTRNGSGTTFCSLWMKAIEFLLEEKTWKRAVLLSTFLCSWWFFASFTSPDDSCLSLLFF